MEQNKLPMPLGAKILFAFILIMLLGAIFGSSSNADSGNNERCYSFEHYGASACTDGTGRTTYK